MAKISLACSSHFGSAHGKSSRFVTSKPGSESRIRFVYLNEALKKNKNYPDTVTKEKNHYCPISRLDVAVASIGV